MHGRFAQGQTKKVSQYTLSLQQGIVIALLHEDSRIHLNFVALDDLWRDKRSRVSNNIPVSLSVSQCLFLCLSLSLYVFYLSLSVSLCMSVDLTWNVIGFRP